MKHFNTPKTSLGDLHAETAATVITAAADVALVVDAAGVVRDVALGSDDLAPAGCEAWVGRPWVDTVTVESRPKVEALLKAARADDPPRWRHVNHPVQGGDDLPVMYSAVRVNSDGNTVVIGRDLRSLSALQQRLVNAQQSLERDYGRLRHLETRYRLLFQLTGEAVLIVDAGSRRVQEANAAAMALFGGSPRQIIGRAFPHGLDEEGTRAVQTLMASVRARGDAEPVNARLADGGTPVTVSATLFRQERSTSLLVRLVPQPAETGPARTTPAAGRLLEAVAALPEGFVLTDPAGRILSANPAFLDLIQLAAEDQVRGESLGRWLGRPGVDLGTILAALKETGSVRLIETTVQGEYGLVTEVEVSAVALPDGEPPCIGFGLRDVTARLTPEPPSAEPELPHPVGQLTELVGRVPLKDIIRDTTDMIERLCIQAALDLTGDNRASAAEMLGLSRQSLYVKLRRYGLLGDIEGDE